jgi:hypothetical protein
MDMNQLARLEVRDGEETRTVTIDLIPFTIGRHTGRSLCLSNEYP